MVWIRISGMNIWYYQEQAMLHIVEAIGKPVKVDFATKSAEKGKYARAFPVLNAEITESGDLKEGIKHVSSSAGPMHLKQYEWFDVIRKGKPKVDPTCATKKKGFVNKKNQFSNAHGPYHKKHSQLGQKASPTLHSKHSSFLHKGVESVMHHTPAGKNGQKRPRPASLQNSPTQEDTTAAGIFISPEPPTQVVEGPPASDDNKNSDRSAQFPVTSKKDEASRQKTDVMKPFDDAPSSNKALPTIEHGNPVLVPMKMDVDARIKTSVVKSSNENARE
ncbi:hypothetical protein PIB30_017461 [Stylosanthes scabra]|uniref:DUF4283 domain-containing protein n=1 Tax=Stylosanthes scabra TaxID=79078 RepID=A0ABU6Y9H6_9FABA|nr:hypothetical protein [Stylosanthes scabra]